MSRWTPSIVPNGYDQNVYLVEDCLGREGCVWREADSDKTDLETIIEDLLSGQYKDPRRIILFNTVEHIADDVSEDVAIELQERCHARHEELPLYLENFVSKHFRMERQLRLRLV